MRAVVCAFALCAAAFAGDAPNPATWSRDVAPIVQKNCQGCHRPGEAAPMSLLTYKDARPWAKAMREAILLKKMPPWFADPHYGKFRNDRSLPEADARTLIAWVDAGAPEGDPRELPSPAAFVQGWNIGRPDLELEMPAAFQVPASGTIDYQYLVIPTRFTEDRWVQMAEVRPGNRAVVHHVIAFVRAPGSKWMKDAVPGVPFVPRKSSPGERSGSGDDDGNPGQAEFLVGYAPGAPAAVFAPGRAKLIKAGSDIVFQLHYTANGAAAADRTKIGLIFSKEPPRERVVTLAALNRKFVIPPGAANHEVTAEFEFASDATLVSLFPHMHLRGKDFVYRANYPSGESEILLKVPRYDFNWQLAYAPAEDKLLPKGTRIACTAHYDNSPNNPFNPDATQQVRWGDQSWEEMMIGFVDVAVPAGMDVKNLLPERKSGKRAD